jgi:hypothetical protein
MFLKGIKMDENNEVMMGCQEIDLDVLDMTVQTRSAIRPNAVKEYRDAILAGVKMEPGYVIRTDDGRNILACGFHRAQAYRDAGHVTMPVSIERGTPRDAVWAGIVDNLRHTGERLTNADKRRNVEMAIQFDGEKSDRHIAEVCKCSPTFVGKIRGELSSGVHGGQVNRVGRDGKIYSLPANTGQLTQPEPRKNPDRREPIPATDDDALSDVDTGQANADPTTEPSAEQFDSSLPTAGHRPGCDCIVCALGPNPMYFDDGPDTPAALHESMLRAFDALCEKVDALDRQCRYPAAQAKLDELDGILRGWSIAS